MEYGLKFMAHLVAKDGSRIPLFEKSDNLKKKEHASFRTSTARVFPDQKALPWTQRFVGGPTERVGIAKPRCARSRAT